MLIITMQQQIQDLYVWFLQVDIDMEDLHVCSLLNQTG